METNEAAEVLKTFVLTHGLPKTDMALFGIKCPYCGKSDRIRELEEPDALTRRWIRKIWQSILTSGTNLPDQTDHWVSVNFARIF